MYMVSFSLSLFRTVRLPFGSRTMPFLVIVITGVLILTLVARYVCHKRRWNIILDIARIRLQLHKTCFNFVEDFFSHLSHSIRVATKKLVGYYQDTPCDAHTNERVAHCAELEVI